MRMLAHDVEGDGPAVLLIHEGIADRRMWEPQVAPFVAAGYAVVRCDLREFGESPPATEPYSHIADVHDLLATLGITRATVVGGSLGARVALEYALTYPDSVEALVLVVPGLRDMERTPELERAWAEEDALIEAGDVEGGVEVNLRTWVDGPARTPDQVDRDVRERVREMQRHALEVQIAAPDVREEPFNPPASGRLGEIGCPTLVIVGDLDQKAILMAADRLAAGIQGARKEVIPGTAHVPSMEKPDEFNRLVLDFLQTT
jgi:3-oxoadipate enol-lactonase